MQTPAQLPQINVNINDLILNGKFFHSPEKVYALEAALEYAGSGGYVATFSELMAAKINKDKIASENNHRLWDSVMGVRAHTEEIMGIDIKGRFYRPGTPTLVYVNGGGPLTPEKIRQEYQKKHQEKTFDYELFSIEEKVFDDLLCGMLPDKTPINLYTINDIRKGVIVPHRNAIVMPFSKGNMSCAQKSDFLENTQFIALSGNLGVLESYYEKIERVFGSGDYYRNPSFYENPLKFKGRILALDPKFNDLFCTPFHSYPFFAVASGNKI